MKTTIYTDGGARGNPGPAAYGYVIYKDEKKRFEKGEYIGVATNNIAEYTGVLKALEFAQGLKDCKDVEVILDSELVQKQMTGIYKIKNEGLKEIATQIKRLEKEFDQVTFTHVKREKNKEADSLVNKALDQQSTQE